jgi:hypothetical protein
MFMVTHSPWLPIANHSSFNEIRSIHYDFDIVLKVNKVNQNANCLSQNPCSNEENIISAH